MSSQHLSDEAVAAFADGVLVGHARERAARHLEGCPECKQAVRVQREAAWVLRGAAEFNAPSDLVARLRSLPMTTPIPTLPTVIGPDGTTMLATSSPQQRRPALAAFAPMAAFVPTPKPPKHRSRPMVATAAAVALAGALTAASGTGDEAAPQPGTAHNVRTVRGSTPAGPAVAPGAATSVVPAFIDSRTGRP